jgi:hypothetical protein
MVGPGQPGPRSRNLPGAPGSAADLSHLGAALDPWHVLWHDRPMHPCSHCRRHLLAKTASCPFCGTAQRDVVTPIGGFAGVLLGLALVGCGDDSSEPTTSAAETGQMTDPSATDSASASVGTTSSAVTDTDTASGADYGGPTSGFETSATATTDTATEDTTDGTSTGTDSTGTDTGASSSDTGTASGSDYGGAAPRD